MYENRADKEISGEMKPLTGDSFISSIEVILEFALLI